MLYCLCCRLFTNSVTGTSSKFITGFQQWWKLNPKVKDHENSAEYAGEVESNGSWSTVKQDN